ncbi:MAG: hypothetical protein HYT87_07955 [Nitrospirae bacterium]|nr:hypothetical protein [Nitrospirota bacterium]
MKGYRTLVLLIVLTTVVLIAAVALGIRSRRALQSLLPAATPSIPAEAPRLPSARAPSASTPQADSTRRTWPVSEPEPEGRTQAPVPAEGPAPGSAPRWVVPGPPAPFSLPTVDWEALMNFIERRIGETDLRSMPPPEPTDAALTQLGGRLEAVAKKVVDSDTGRDLVEYYKSLVTLGSMPRASNFTATLKKSHEKFLEEEAGNYINVSQYYKQIGKNIGPDWERLKEAKLKLWVNAYVHLLAADLAASQGQ